MQCVVTGCAGFIGSHLSERLLALGHSVIGIDSFSNFYGRAVKQRNVKNAVAHPNFILREGDVVSMELDRVLDGTAVVFHQAAQAGVRTSWGKQFEAYTHNNVLATQRLLEACRDGKVSRFIYASSSSIYGNSSALPLSESVRPQPISPYGVTKLAAEHLCTLYHTNFGVPTVSLRYFTVYGARQRPDMAFHRFMRAAYVGTPLQVNEDGQQTRDFTHVSDIVRANILAAERPDCIGHVYNIAGGSRVTLNHVLALISTVTKRELQIEYRPGQAGDVRDTYADISAASRDLGYAPLTALEAGLRDEAAWLQAEVVPTGMDSMH
jgi:nucleoside-diphosphate-sugar epimerase